MPHWSLQYALVGSPAASGAPGTEPVSTADAKSWMRVDLSDDNDLIDFLIAAARERLEEDAGRSLITQTWELKLDRFPSSDLTAIVLPRPPLISVSSITYVDEDGDTQTWSSAEYDVDANSEPGRITPAYNYTWPSTRDQANAVTITFVAGYGAASAVPKKILAAIKFLAAHWYEHRESVVIGTITSSVPDTWEALVSPIRILYDNPFRSRYG